jgi:hypothetical protein
MANLDVFGVQPQYDMEKAKEVLEAKLNPSWVKQRKQGSATLSYIGGHTVIRLLNKAFGYQWSFEIVKEEIVASIPKWDKFKNQEIPQPPVAKVLGRLTVPGLGIKEQYGSKVLIGGATEQESAFKSASTDAMKKCASLFGIGLELYGDDEGFGDETQSQPSQVQPPAQKQYQAPPQEKQYQAPPQEKQYQAPPAQPAQPQQQASAAPGGWVQADIDRLKELKAILGITNNAQLDPYVKEFFDNPNVTFANITPENIKAVNIFLSKKAEVL